MLTLFNTLTRTREEFRPLDPKRVTFYHCGPTLYWTQHIGNLRAVVMADVVTRTLEYLGYRVLMVRNYTDVGHLTGDNRGNADIGEDRMAKGSRREGLTPGQIADKYQTLYDKHVEMLNVRTPDIRPRATEHIPEMIALIQTLLEKGFAYQTDLAVYFDVSKVKEEEYTKLSGQKSEMNIAEAGRGDVSDPRKRNPRDFSLWFFKAGAHKNALQTWKSPFSSSLVSEGEGFPGWHIECSAMAQKYLGETIDLHMGGVEHIPLHHTNEIAQSESATGKPFARYWLHNEHLTVEGKKMAKSEGTGYTLDEIVDMKYEPLALRYFFLTAHYRSKQNFTWDALGGASAALKRLYDAMRTYKSNPDIQERSDEKPVDFESRFQESLEDDFNTPRALAVVWDVVKSKLSMKDKLTLLLKFDRVLGLKFDDVPSVQTRLDIPPEVERLMKEREAARMKRDFATSDVLRKKIEDAGYRVEDTPGGSRIVTV